MSANKPKNTPSGDYEIGYGKPPKATQFQPGKSGNPRGRPRGRPSLLELVLEEAARVVKYQVGDKVMHMDRDRAVMRKLYELAMQGKLPAIRLLTEILGLAQAALSAKGDPEPPLTEEELALIEMLKQKAGA